MLVRHRRAAQRVARFTGTVLLVAVTLGCAAWIAPTLMGYERYVITGGSMSGTFEIGSVVLTRDVPVEDLHTGDVITYLPPSDSGVSNLVTHRITAIRGGGGEGPVFRTQGDANATPDPWRFRLDADTQPVVERAVPLAGYVFIALAEPWVRRILIGVPAALIALVALRDLVRALRGPRAEASPSSAPVTPVPSVT